MKLPKSKLFIAVVCLVLPLLFASCSKDEESENDPMPFVPIEQNDFTADILQPDINYPIPIEGDDPDNFFNKAVGTYEGTLTVYDPKTKQVIPSDFDNHVSAKFESFLNQFSLTPIPHLFTLYALKKDQYAYVKLYKIIENKIWWKTESIHDYRTILIGRNKKNPSEVAFQLYNPNYFYSFTSSPHKNRYDLREIYFNVCGTFNNTTKEMTVYIKPAGALFYDSKLQGNNIKAEFNDVYFICKLKKTA
ncbi:hypothetical protein [Prevotella melaninogenica]